MDKNTKQRAGECVKIASAFAIKLSETFGSEMHLDIFIEPKGMGQTGNFLLNGFVILSFNNITKANLTKIRCGAYQKVPVRALTGDSCNRRGILQRKFSNTEDEIVQHVDLWDPLIRRFFEFRTHVFAATSTKLCNLGSSETLLSVTGGDDWEYDPKDELRTYVNSAKLVKSLRMDNDALMGAIDSLLITRPLLLKMVIPFTFEDDSDTTRLYMMKRGFVKILSKHIIGIDSTNAALFLSSHLNTREIK